MEGYETVVARGAEYMKGCGLPVKVTRLKDGVLQLYREASGEVVRVGCSSTYRPFSVRVENTDGGSLWRLVSGEDTVMDFAERDDALRVCGEIAAYSEEDWAVAMLPDGDGDVIVTGGHGEDVRLYRKASGETKVIGLKWRGCWELALKCHRCVGGGECWVLFVDGAPTMKFASRYSGEVVLDKVAELRGFGGLWLEPKPVHVENRKAPMLMVLLCMVGLAALFAFVYIRADHARGTNGALPDEQAAPRIERVDPGAR